MNFKWTTHLQSPIYHDSLSIREAVFIKEQHVHPDLEIDALEDKCHYVVVYDQHQAIGTARLYFKSETIGKVQRVAILASHRGKNIGHQLLREIERYASALQLTCLTLGAQNHAIPFYEKLGYHIVGEEYEEANILHHDMEKTL
ncbi:MULTISPECIES: GNAT family N-acetyltransferase [unclassified Granulicatella]|uniref:GNAT family N-acetyltransferase n=1 Tax=unclassified Granulicatella TaxID=2630493 RepID=UPI0010744BEE|nr:MULTISPECIES: GNAT family N-acetyltransferase [unclassified Granulicatella]MBF0779844.1 GNAT family N-acetyltransferase [Granulicatella sp. 19428wC4_WM01]TFU96144.1 GNAT family N-acetyltransferase [Granulicatella sp. WM01]